MFQIARGSEATLRWMYFSLQKSTHHSEDPKKRYTVSLRKAPRPRLYLLGRTSTNKARLPELNHEVLGGLSISRSPVLSLFSTNKNTKSAETTIYTELFIGHK